MAHGLYHFQMFNGLWNTELLLPIYKKRNLQSPNIQENQIYSLNKEVCFHRPFCTCRILSMLTPTVTSWRQDRPFQTLKIRVIFRYDPGQHIPTSYSTQPCFFHLCCYISFTSALPWIKDPGLWTQSSASRGTTSGLQVNKHHSKDKPALITVLCFNGSLLSGFVWVFKSMKGCWQLWLRGQALNTKVFF